MSETVVIGGGLAGGAAATLLAAAGRRVHLIERERAPVDKVCGEFLSESAQRPLAALGLDLDALGASTISQFELAWGQKRIELPLPFVARGLSRKRLDEALLAQAVAAGARVDRGVTVRAINGDRVDTTAGTLTPATILLASGKHEVRGARRDTANCATGYVGFKMHWRLPPAARERLRGQVNVTLFEGGYAGLQLIEDDIANLCLLVDKQRLAALGGDWPHLLDALFREPCLGQLLGDAEPLWARPAAISAIPYGFLNRAAGSPSLFHLGDQAAVIPSFCGEGMAIALRSATLAAEVIGTGGDGADHRRLLHDQLARRIRLSMRVQRAGQRPLARRLLWSAMRASPRLASSLIRATRIAQSPAPPTND